MGVRGLTTFFNQNPDLSKKLKLHDTKVIIDGNNLIHIIYFNHNIDFMYGGDYKRYAKAIKKYFSVYEECNIKPIVVFDGGYDKSERKFETLLERSKTRLSQVQCLAKFGCCSGKVLPVIAWDVFHSVLKELGIVFCQCDYEADDQVTVLANNYECPVISADSDFYIFDIHKGFIHHNSIELTVKVDFDSEEKEYKFLSCRIYNIDDFISCFPGIGKNALPLFGTLIGNDFVEGHEFDNFFSNIKLPKYKGGKLIVNSRHKRMIGLLCWLKGNTLENAIDQVLLRLRKNRRDYIKSVIEKAVEGYRLNKCNLSYIIDNEIDKLRDILKVDNNLTTSCGYPLPINFIIEFHCGHFPSFFLNAITHHRVFLQPQVESTDVDSSYDSSVYIRQVLYGILLHHNLEAGKCKDIRCTSPVVEYDSHKGSLSKKIVEPICLLKSNGPLPKLDEIFELDENRRISIIAETLGVNIKYFAIFPKEWQLLMGCINYWLHNCFPYTSEAFLNSLILNLIYFGIIKCKNLSYLNDTQNPLEVIISKIDESEIRYASENLKKYTEPPTFNNGSPLILHIVHSYNQLQTCILFTNYLNKLLRNQLQLIAVEKCLAGTMLYNLTKDIICRSNPDLFLSEKLGRQSNLFRLFTTLKEEIYQNAVPELILKNDSLLKKKKSRSTS